MRGTGTGGSKLVSFKNAGLSFSTITLNKIMTIYRQQFNQTEAPCTTYTKVGEQRGGRSCGGFVVIFTIYSKMTRRKMMCIRIFLVS